MPLSATYEFNKKLKKNTEAPPINSSRLPSNLPHAFAKPKTCPAMTLEMPEYFKVISWTLPLTLP